MTPSRRGPQAAGGFSCLQCGAKFATLQALGGHKSVHSSKKRPAPAPASASPPPPLPAPPPLFPAALLPPARLAADWDPRAKRQRVSAGLDALLAAHAFHVAPAAPDLLPANTALAAQLASFARASTAASAPSASALALLRPWLRSLAAASILPKCPPGAGAGAGAGAAPLSPGLLHPRPHPSPPLTPLHQKRGAGALLPSHPGMGMGLLHNSTQGAASTSTHGVPAGTGHGISSASLQSGFVNHFGRRGTAGNNCQTSDLTPPFGPPTPTPQGCHLEGAQGKRQPTAATVDKESSRLFDQEHNLALEPKCKDWPPTRSSSWATPNLLFDGDASSGSGCEKSGSSQTDGCSSFGDESRNDVVGAHLGLVGKDWLKLDVHQEACRTTLRIAGGAALVHNEDLDLTLRL